MSGAVGGGGGAEPLDFSGLFRMDTVAVARAEVTACACYELGLKKLVALSAAGAGEAPELELVYWQTGGGAGVRGAGAGFADQLHHSYTWDFVTHPILCMCFEPSGTWLLVTSNDALFLVPFLPLFDREATYDRRWSLTEHTSIAVDDGLQGRPVAVTWWLTKEAENIVVVAQKVDDEEGLIQFYSLDSKTFVGETKIACDITEVHICFDDSLDLIVLLITGSNNQCWKLILEHRSVGYNWVRECTSHQAATKEKKGGLLGYIRHLSKEKITFFSLNNTTDGDKNLLEYSTNPTEYMPRFRKGSHKWKLSPQYVNGRHFVTAFEVNEGTLILENTEEEMPSHTLRPKIKNDGLYCQALWCQKLVYVLKKNTVEIHSANFSIIQSGSAQSSEDTLLWSAELMGEFICAYLLSSRAILASSSGWNVPTFLCDLQLPRFSLEPCLVVTTQGAFLVNTIVDACEWLVGIMMRGGHGSERSAAAVGAPVSTLLRAAADMLLSRSKLPPAQYLYSLSQNPADGWIARLGVFGRWTDLASYKHPPVNLTALGNPAITMRILGQLLRIATNPSENLELDVQCPNLTPLELEEICCVASSLGLWGVVPMYSTHRGMPRLLLSALRSRNEICRGALNCLLKQKHMLSLLLEEDAMFLFDFLNENCHGFDARLLKQICLWLSPLNDQLAPVLRDLKDGRTNIYTSRFLKLINTFARIVSEIDLLDPRLDMTFSTDSNTEVWKEKFQPRRTVSCGLAHWALVDGGQAQVMLASTQVVTELVGRVVSVACGRHHTLVLTENGVYSAGDNSYGQLGIGEVWRGPAGEGAGAGGALLRVSRAWGARVVSVAAGHYHSAAVDAGGRLFTWGWGVHGQLGLGSIEDAVTPRPVSRLQGRKVSSVGCGACHTAALMKNGEVWAFGAGMFGQLGSGNRNKSSVPVRVALLPGPVEMIAVGYFHNLALSNKGEVWSWGASPQMIRMAATHARRAASPQEEVDKPAPEVHLWPTLVNTEAVDGRIVQMSAGWHHSCLLNNIGNLYSWGLNFDGQLGIGDRKLALQPQVSHREAQPIADISYEQLKSVEYQLKKIGSDTNSVSTKCMVACGGDFTIYVDDDGKIFIAGNTHQQNTDSGKSGNRMIMMKTTKRVIKIPANRSNNKFVFQYCDKFDAILSSKPDDREMIVAKKNPLNTLKDFNNDQWLEEVLITLKSWIKEASISKNLNVAARLAYHNKMYTESLKLQLENIKTEYTQEEMDSSGIPNSGGVRTDALSMMKRDEKIAVQENIVGKRIKDIAMAILNERAYPELQREMYKKLPSCCDENLQKVRGEAQIVSTFENGDVLACKAAQVIDRSMSVFPANAEAWNEYFNLAKDYFVDNSLPVRDLELVLQKYMEGDTCMVSSAVMFSDDCASYAEMLTPKFYLSTCSKLLDTWQ